MDECCGILQKLMNISRLKLEDIDPVLDALGSGDRDVFYKAIAAKELLTRV